MFTITTIDTNSENISVFSSIEYSKISRNDMLLSDQIEAHNFRLRESHPPYQTDFHLAGDPTLIIIQKGILRIQLQDGEHRDFNAGDMFIAADNLPESVIFDGSKHGHMAVLIGQNNLLALHIKLKNWEQISTLQEFNET